MVTTPTPASTTQPATQPATSGPVDHPGGHPGRAVCAVPRCGHPTPDFVCRSCLDQLRHDLWTIGGHPTHHRARPLPPTTADEQWRHDVHAGLAAELLVTMARLDAPGEHAGRHLPDPDLEPEDGDEPIATTVLLFRPSAAAVLGEMRTTLNMWVRVLIDRRRLPAKTHPGPDVAAMALWLDRHRQVVACDPDGGRLVAEVAALVPKATAVVYPRAWEYLGPCMHWHCEDGPSRCRECRTATIPPPEELWVERGLPWVKCWGCGRVYDVETRRAWLLQQAEDQLVTAEHAADALRRWVDPRLGQLLNPRRIRRWGDDGRITVHRPHPGERVLDALGRPQRAPVRYRVGDVLRQLGLDAEREAHRARQGARRGADRVPRGA